MWRDKQPHDYSWPILGRSYSDLISGYSMPILFPHWAKRVRDCRQNHHGCRQNKLRLLWNALLTTPYVKKHYKYMFLVAKTCAKCSYVTEENMRPGVQRLAFEVKLEYIAHRSTNIPWAAVCGWASFQTTGAWCFGQFAQFVTFSSVPAEFLSFVYISVRLIGHRLIREFAQFVTFFYPLEAFCSAKMLFPFRFWCLSS